MQRQPNRADVLCKFQKAPVCKTRPPNGHKPSCIDATPGPNVVGRTFELVSRSCAYDTENLVGELDLDGCSVCAFDSVVARAAPCPFWLSCSWHVRRHRKQALDLPEVFAGSFVFAGFAGFCLDIFCARCAFPLIGDVTAQCRNDLLVWQCGGNADGLRASLTH